MTESAAVLGRDKILGAVLGAAIGDALGYPVEFIRSAQEIRDRYGPDGVTGYVRYRQEEGGRRFAPYSDDTQMAEVVLRSLIWSRASSADLDATMRHMAKGFVLWSRQPQGGHRAPGNACMSGCRALGAGDPWYESGAADAGGCGSVMRSYPFGIVFAHDSTRAEAWAVEHSKMTHRAPIALAACAAMSNGVVLALEEPSAEVVVEAMIDAASRYDANSAAMIGEAADRAKRGDDPEVVLARFLGWAAHEAIAAAAYVFTRHPGDPRAALLEAVNSPGDSDTIGTLVGALAGARCGLGALPAAWVLDLERSAELLSLAETVANGR
jgi:ADP-ribosylglycohydrolase